jgi:hypothetical protein
MDDDIQAVALSGEAGVSIHTGFPNPALDHKGSTARLGLDLNQLLIKHPSSTYLFKIAGHHWADHGIFDGDIAIIDRSRASKPQALVIAWQAAGFQICRRNQLASDEAVWGTITAVIHQYEAGKG